MFELICLFPPCIFSVTVYIFAPFHGQNCGMSDFFSIFIFYCQTKFSSHYFTLSAAWVLVTTMHTTDKHQKLIQGGVDTESSCHCKTVYCDRQSLTNSFKEAGNLQYSL